MGRAVHLEDFDSLRGFEPEIVETTVEDADRAAVYDEGYAAGWEAAREALAREAEQGRAALGTHLQDLSFTFHEARAHVMRSLHPMLLQVMEIAVPAVLRATLAQRLAEEIGEMAREVGDAPVSIVVSPEDAADLNAILEGITALPATIREDPSLGRGCLHLLLGEAAREIDIDALGHRITDALRALDIINEDKIANG